MSIYADIAESVLGFLPDFAIGGITSWTVTRSSGDGVTGAVTTATHSITAYAIRDRIDSLTPNIAGSLIADAPFVLFAASNANIQVNDKLTNGSYAFRVKGTPKTDLGMLICEIEEAR